MKKNNELNIPIFPPENLTPPQKKRLDSAIEGKDLVSNSVFALPRPKPLKSLWRNIEDFNEEGSQFSSILDVPPSPIVLDSKSIKGSITSFENESLFKNRNNRSKNKSINEKRSRISKNSKQKI